MSENQKTDLRGAELELSRAPVLGLSKDYPIAAIVYKFNYIRDQSVPYISLTLEDTGDVDIGVNTDAFEKIDMRSRRILTLHVIWHFILHHCGSRGKYLIGRFGQEVFDVASDLTAFSFITPELGKILDENGIDYITAEKLGLPDNKNTEEYCEILKGMLDKMQQPDQFKSGFSPGGLSNPQETECEDAEGEGDSGEGDEGEETDKDKEGGKGKAKGQQGKEKNKKGKEQGNSRVGPTPPKNSGIPQKMWTKMLEGYTSPDKLNGRATDAIADNALWNATANLLPRLDVSDDKSRGTIPAEAKDIIKALRRLPVVSWETVMREKVGHHISERLQETRKKLNRRDSERECNWPGYKRTRECLVWFAIDTSGSMSNSELAKVDAELKGLAEYATIRIVHCDAAVHNIHDYDKNQPLEMFFGRGGTDFSPIFAAAKEAEEQPDVIILFTDGCGGALSKEEVEAYDPVFVLTEEGMTVADFKKNITNIGEVIKLKKQAEL